MPGTHPFLHHRHHVRLLHLLFFSRFVLIKMRHHRRPSLSTRHRRLDRRTRHGYILLECCCECQSVAFPTSTRGSFCATADGCTRRTQRLLQLLGEVEGYSGGAGCSRRARSAERRREDKRAYPISKYGHVEPFLLTVKIRLASGTLLNEITVNDFALAALLATKTAVALSMWSNRFRLLYKDNEMDLSRTVFQLLKGNRFADITCVVLPPANCSACGAAPVLSGWENLLTGLPEYHKKCDCRCCEFEEYGWRTKRLWTQMIVAWHRRQMDCDSDSEQLQ